MPTDPYYNIENVIGAGAQNTAVGRTSGMSPTALTSVVQANYADQAAATRANQTAYMEQEQINNQTAQTNQWVQQSKQAVSASKQNALKQDVSGGVQLGDFAIKGYKALFPDKTTTPTTPTQPGAGQPGTTTPTTPGTTPALSTDQYSTQAYTMGDTGVGQAITPEASPQMTGATPGLIGGDTGLIAGEGVGEGAQMVSAGTEVGAGTGGTLMGWLGDLIGSEFISSLGDTVLCTELSHQGKLDKEVLRTEGIYVSSHISKEEYAGYRIIADPLVKLMQRSKLFTQIIAPFIRAFAYEMAHRVNPEIQGSKLGSYILLYGIPLCRFVYKLRDWRLSCRVS